MRIRLWLAAAVVLALSTAPAMADRRTDAKEHVEWGITVAQKGLWPQAVLQFEKATEIDPTYAAAWNDLAIGYEQTGKFDDARNAYDKALKIDHANQFIRTNYDLFRDIYDRQNRRRGF
jgi:Flp pilus assembly protein TadD